MCVVFCHQPLTATAELDCGITVTHTSVRLGLPSMFNCPFVQLHNQIVLLLSAKIAMKKGP